MKYIKWPLSAIAVFAFAFLSIAKSGYAQDTIEVESAQTVSPLLELSTSEGCSSCPGAEEWLGRLAAALDDSFHAVPLAFHVDYWNYLGWEDALSARFATARQQAYQNVSGRAYVYTPQFIVGGVREFSLRNHDELKAHLREIEPRAGVGMHWADTDLHLTPIEDGLRQGRIWRIAFHDRIETRIEAGENEGRNLSHHHSVQEIEQIGVWENQPLIIPISKPETYGVAIFISDDQGQIHGAADWRLKDLFQTPARVKTNPNPISGNLLIR